MISAFICKNLLFLVLLKLAIAFSSETVTVSVPKMNIGFIGCGTIASSIATGLLRQSEHPISTIYVTRRSERKSSQLVEKFPDKVVICDDNQEICNKCELIFLCVLPEQVSSVLKSITFTEDKKLISLVSTSKVADLIHQSGLPSENCFKMICLPAVAELEGTPLIVPKSNSYVPTLMASLGGGTCIQCEDESIMEAMMTTTCMMGPMYGLMRRHRDFLIKQGVPAIDANNVVARQYWGMVKDALVRVDDESSLDELVAEQTPGGLNEQALRNLESVGMLDQYERTMEAVLSRIRGESDGSLK